jgi:hypothetical protein
MTASAGVAAAADEATAAAVPGGTGGARAAIVVVSRDAGAREILRRELSGRYGADYRIMACGRPAELASRLRGLRKGGLPVALVIGGVGAADPDGIEVLSGIRAVDPAALRVAAVGWGDWESRRSVFDAVAVGAVDRWVTCPAQAPDEEFHRSVTEFLRDWGSQRGGGFEPVRVIGERWSARSQGAARPVRPAPHPGRLLRRRLRARPAAAGRPGPGIAGTAGGRAPVRGEGAHPGGSLQRRDR